MAERQLVIGGFYKHFKDKLYQVRGIAYHSETKEKMVVYQALYDDYAMYVRPYDMFISEVDHQKYPQVVQQYRFEQVFLDSDEAKESTETEDNNIEKVEIEVTETKDDVVTDNQEIDGRLLQFLEADSYNEKLNVLNFLKSGLDDSLIDAMAASMEVEVPAGTIEERYLSLRSVIMTHLKYEYTRVQK